MIGSIIGTGVFALPSALAPVRAVEPHRDRTRVPSAHWRSHRCFGWLNKRVPGSGGPYLYARDAFGDFGGFITSWSYWLTAWIGNAAIVVAWVGYVEVFVNKGGNKWGAVAIALVGLWIPALINISGIRNLAGFQNVTTVLKFVPLVFMATIGLLFIHAHNFGAFNPSGLSLGGSISAAAAIALFLLPRPRGRVRGRRTRPQPAAQRQPGDDDRDLGCAFVYILGTVTVFGTVSHHSAAHLDGSVLRLGQRDVRRRVGRQGDGRRGHHLRHRLPQRLDADLRRDADGGCARPPVPAAVRPAEPP